MWINFPSYASMAILCWLVSSGLFLASGKKLLNQLAAAIAFSGTAILLISEDLDEIRTLSDRIAIIYEGKITGVVGRGQASVEQIGLMMAGISMQEAMHSSN